MKSKEIVFDRDCRFLYCKECEKRNKKENSFTLFRGRVRTSMDKGSANICGIY